MHQRPARLPRQVALLKVLTSHRLDGSMAASSTAVKRATAGTVPLTDWRGRSGSLHGEPALEGGQVP